MTKLRTLIGPTLALLLAACSTTKEGVVDNTPLAGAGQLVTVTTANWKSPRGQLRTFERTETGWREVGSARPVMIGREGSAWGVGLHMPQLTGPKKWEGDGKAPAGAFRIGFAFGYDEQADTGLEYHGMNADDWCVDVPGRYYNQVVNTARVGEEAVEGSTEPMRRDLHMDGDQRYRLGFVIEHNAAGGDRGGSCIFAHVWKSPDDATAGCTAMSDADMQQLMRWLDADRNPRFVLLPAAEYARLQPAWMLP